MANKSFKTVAAHLTGTYAAVYTPAATKQFAGKLHIVPANPGLNLDVDVRLVLVTGGNFQYVEGQRVVSKGALEVELKIQKSDSVHAKVDGYVETAITAISKDTACIVTMASVPFANGQKIIVDGGDMTEIPLGVYTAQQVSDVDFELQTEDGVAINSTGYTTYTTGGTSALHLADALVVGYEETEPT